MVFVHNPGATYYSRMQLIEIDNRHTQNRQTPLGTVVRSAADDSAINTTKKLIWVLTCYEKTQAPRANGSREQELRCKCPLHTETHLGAQCSKTAAASVKHIFAHGLPSHMKAQANLGVASVQMRLNYQGCWCNSWLAQAQSHRRCPCHY